MKKRGIFSPLNFVFTKIIHIFVSNMTLVEIKEFFKDNEKACNTLTSGEVATIMASAPSMKLEMDRQSQEYYYSIDCNDLKNVSEAFLNDLRTLGFYLSDDFKFLFLTL